MHGRPAARGTVVRTPARRRPDAPRERAGLPAPPLPFPMPSVRPSHTRSLARALAAATLTATALSVAAARPAGAQFQAFTVGTPLAGNQAFGGAFGIDFDVGAAPIVVSALGAFDDGQDGLRSPITVRLYERTTQSLFASLTFPTGTGAMLRGGYRIADLATALRLPAGFQGSLVATGYGDPQERLANNGYWPFPGTITTGGFLDFVGGGRYTLDPDAFPTTVDGGPAVHFAGANVVFDRAPTAVVATSTVPEPSTWALVGAGLLVVSAVARRRRAAAEGPAGGRRDDV
ncbi:hypothetical protein tb265_17040 [Gemmatimonadetes bacterium T265]|nr:hypothetical protein tb265_17040 [Gemmatimonadetes bacterium T265]